LATEEMRNDFDELAASLKRPKDFSLKVRSHSGLLTITSVAKLYFSKSIELSFSGTNPQTYKLSKNIDIIKNNKSELDHLVYNLGQVRDENIIMYNGKINYILFNNQDASIVSNFIENYKIEQPNINNKILSEYINKQDKKSNIKAWSICIVLNTDSKVQILSNDNGEINKPALDPMNIDLSFSNKKLNGFCKVRNPPKDKLNDTHYFISKNQVDDIKDRQADLNGKFKTNTDIKNERKQKKQGLLLIYPLDSRSAQIENGIPIIGYSLHFPKIDNEVKVTYRTTIFNDYDQDLKDDDDQE
jgi:hypothetical protein